MVATSTTNGSSTVSGGSSLLSQILGQIAPEQQIGEAGIAAETGALDLQPQLFGIEQGDLASQLANQEAQYGIQGQGIGLSGEQLGIQGRGLTEQGQYLGTQQGIANQEYGIETAHGTGTFALQGLSNQLAAQQQAYSTAGNAAASGSIGSKGYGLQSGWNTAQNFISNQGLQNTEQQAKLQQQLQTAGFKYSGEQLQNQQANLGIQGQQLNLQGQGLTLEEQMAGSQYGYQNTLNRVQGAQTQMGDYSNLLDQIAQLGGNVTNAASSAGILQGLNLPNSTQPNSGN